MRQHRRAIALRPSSGALRHLLPRFAREKGKDGEAKLYLSAYQGRDPPILAMGLAGSSRKARVRGQG
jgi:hypothetical protein